MNEFLLLIIFICISIGTALTIVIYTDFEGYKEIFVKDIKDTASDDSIKLWTKIVGFGCLAIGLILLSIYIKQDNK
jgi:hypothetical protein